ncbi:hypothetical protein BLEM_1108 [Bifidobacterium lemurum]|uniref:Chromosome partitioning protein ParB n=1 Tax=Bifidobacterium lemurum TaxID=1603886 RepID=A0A261FTQ7_9BIFI|nr:hypothetical protein [Bifidobacterium lemurum]OZG62562.1 hypothetical protein BLEM_1108 [Bifidobacterium lemurum]QOL33894.1 hypothetical protein BL8807_09010 [Bifidobacterium lemurum]
MEINRPTSTANRLASTLTAAQQPKTRLVHATFSLDPATHKRLKIASVRSGVPMSQMLTQWIEDNCPPLEI